MLESFAHWVQDVVRAFGYPGVFVLIMLESTLVPIPSEIVMPFAGYMASQGEFSLPVILVINSVAAVVGSGLCYWIGVVGGKPFLVRYGKYFLVRQHEIARTEAFFARHGNKTILIARFLPGIRHVISVPAGVARMPLRGFFVQTFLGATIWGGALIVLGYYVGANWETFARPLKHIDLLIAAILVLALVALGIRFVVRRRREGQ
ncbi:MAG: DedA family protein [Deltaproteobacteria bacterium]|nr:MAG: DedA family protein [Deltaproteobacteria bacterium]